MPMDLFFGNLSAFALESRSSEAFARPSLRALGYFIIHVAGRSYGVRQDDATMLACSFEEVGRRLERRGGHTAPFASNPDGKAIAESVYNATYGPENAVSSLPGLSLPQVHDLVVGNHLQWAPDGDAAFDDGSFVIHLDVEDRVRLLAFKTAGDGSRRLDLASLRDQWLEADVFYRVLQDWRDAFEKEWDAAPKAQPEVRVPLRAAPTTVTIFAVLFSPLLITGYFSAGSAVGFPTTGICLCLIYLAVIGSLFALEITIRGGEIIHRTLFSKRTMPLAAVRHVAVTAVPAPTLTLQGDDETLAFKIKPFSKAAVIYILKAIREASPQASFDAMSETMEQGDFEPLMRETVSARNLTYMFLVIAIGPLIAIIFKWVFRDH
jgi:hypothetical protein